MSSTVVRNKVVLGTVVAVAFALATYIGVRSAISAARPDFADEAARKKAFEAAMKKGDLSLYKAEYWRAAPATAATAEANP